MGRGFTLIELSIVLTIIALVIGGILLGTELVAIAGIRTTISQIESYNSAVNVFRSKYGGLPGDLNAADASALGLCTLASGYDMANGNGLIEILNPAQPPRAFSGEVPVFWRHLSEAALVEGAFGTIGNSAIVSSTGGTLSGVVTRIEQSIPPARIGRQNFVTVYSANNTNYYEINAITQINALGPYRVTRPGLTPSEAYAMDEKIDDGVANTGFVIARGEIGLVGALNQPPEAVPSATVCVVDVSPTLQEYAVSSGTPACALRIEFSRN